MTTGMQLSLAVTPHRNLPADGGLLTGTLKIAGDIPIPCDLNQGDEIVIIVQNADGELLAHRTAEIGPVAFLPIKAKDVGVIGTERAHKAIPSD